MRLTPLHLMIMTLLSSLMLLSLNARASTDLYELSGMATHQSHFQLALTAAQQRYAQQLPRSVHESLVRQSNQRFAAEDMHNRARTRLAVALDDNGQRDALTFFKTPLGRKVVQAETRATAPASIAAIQRGLPAQPLSPERQQLIEQLSRSLPALELGVDVSMALANLATQSANDLLGGLFQVPGELMSGNRNALRNQMQSNLPNTLAHVYRDLSDSELRAYLDWSQSNQGSTTLRAMELAARDALNP